MTYVATPQHINPSPGGHEIYNFGTSFHWHQYCYTLWLIYAYRRRYLKKYMNFTFFTLKLSPLSFRGSWNLQFYVSLIYRCYVVNLVKIGPLVFEKKMDDARQKTNDWRRTTNEDRRQPTATGHLGDSGDIRMVALTLDTFPVYNQTSFLIPVTSQKLMNATLTGLNIPSTHFT